MSPLGVFLGTGAPTDTSQGTKGSGVILIAYAHMSIEPKLSSSVCGISGYLLFPVSFWVSFWVCFLTSFLVKGGWENSDVCGSGVDGVDGGDEVLDEEAGGSEGLVAGCAVFDGLGTLALAVGVEVGDGMFGVVVEVFEVFVAGLVHGWTRG